MSVPPDEDRDGDRDESGPEQPLAFDPYRFGRPEQPVPPEYAPPGYVPPPQPAPPAQPTQPSPPQYPSAYPSPYQPYQQYGAPPPNPYPYPPPPPGYAYGAPKTGNTKATVALVLGILAIVFCWTTVIDLVFIVPAIVLGALARGDAKRFPQRGGMGAATAGLACGLVAIVLAAALGAFLYVRVKPCLDNYEMNSPGYTQCVHDRF
ncbi:MAG TPA: DUF4190 domain-containing protein [Jatrophihabitantaceae bacterium]|nr:DUF4190 domain-containing protein [Jatrophihabitantaceae bacterium]